MQEVVGSNPTGSTIDRMGGGAIVTMTDSLWQSSVDILCAFVIKSRQFGYYT